MTKNVRHSFIGSHMKYLKTGAIALATTLGTVAPVQAVNAANTSANIDKVLDELSRQHNNASSLVKSTRGNTSLALSGSLIKDAKSGETFDMNAMTAAHSSLPMNCYIKVTNKDNGKSVVVKVNDRPAQANRILDLSYGAAKAIGLTQKGVGNVSIERID